MRYVMSDIHGEYELLQRLLNKIKFSPLDELYICGDIIDKGESSVKVARMIHSLPNAHVILGNHEHAFLKYYYSLLEELPEGSEELLRRLSEYFPTDGDLLTFEIVDWIDSFAAYIETEDFICVHAGAPIGDDGFLLPLEDASVEELVHDRRFKDLRTVHRTPKCVFFGHTETNAISGENKIIGYPRAEVKEILGVRDFYKIHLDTGTWSNGVMGCFCIDTLKTYYVKKDKAEIV